MFTFGMKANYVRVQNQKKKTSKEDLYKMSNINVFKLPSLSKGALQVSREPQNIIDAGQTIHGIYRNGKVRFWMKPKPPSPSLLQGFENYICVKAGKLGKIYIILSETAKV